MQAKLHRLEEDLRRRLGEAVYGTDGQTLEGVVGERLVRLGKTLAVAESCSGGGLSDAITDAPGSSRYFLGGIIAYHNDVKKRILGVPSQTLAESGAVSARTAKQMAQGVRRLTGADIGLSTTGIAGPGGGTSRKPVGLVYLGLADSARKLSRRCRFFADRSTIKALTAQTALNWLRISYGSASSTPKRISAKRL
jgi:nicotinamide-nucleotide amidase